MSIIFKENGNKLYYRNSLGNYIELTNVEPLDASKLAKGLMTVEQVNKLEESYNGNISSFTIENGYMTILRRDGTPLIQNIQVGNSIVPLLRPEDLLLTPSTPLSAVEGKYKSSANATFNRADLERFYNNTSILGYSNSSTSQLENTSGYTSIESSGRKFFGMHRLRLGSNFNPNTKYYLKVNWRFNHADVKYGILIKKGNAFFMYYEESSHPSTVQTEDRLYDLSGISGDQIIIFCQSSRWWSFYTRAVLLEHGNAQQINRTGTYEEFVRIKDNLPQGANYFITNTNNNKGVLATKVGTEWKDMIGNTIANKNYRTTV